MSVRSRLQRGLGDLLDVLGPAVHAALPGLDARVEVEAELGGDHDLVADRRERLADQLLVRERAVGLGGVEEGDAALDGGADQRDHLLPVRRRAVGEAHAHAAEAEGRDLEALSECALLHRRSPFGRRRPVAHLAGRPPPSCLCVQGRGATQRNGTQTCARAFLPSLDGFYGTLRGRIFTYTSLPFSCPILSLFVESGGQGLESSGGLRPRQRTVTCPNEQADDSPNCWRRRSRRRLLADAAAGRRVHARRHLDAAAPDRLHPAHRGHRPGAQARVARRAGVRLRPRAPAGPVGADAASSARRRPRRRSPLLGLAIGVDPILVGELLLEMGDAAPVEPSSYVGSTG